MNTMRGLAFFIFAIGGLACPSAAHTQSVDFTALKKQYERLLGEQVTQVYEAGRAKLEADYLAGIGRSLAQAKAAGDLQGALSLQDEIKRVESNDALPATDEHATAVLRNLRAIYRDEVAKLDARRSENQAKLLAPYLQKLQQLEADLTKADRITEAKAIMDYRQGLVASTPIKDKDVAGSPVAPTPPPRDALKTGSIKGRTFLAGSPAAILTSKAESAKLAVVKIENATWGDLKVGVDSHVGSKKYQWDTVPVELEKCQFSMIPNATLKFSVEKAGIVFMATTTRWRNSGSGGGGPEALDLKGLQKQGWHHLPEFDKLSSNDSAGWMVFHKQCNAGESHSIRTEKYIAPKILLPK